MRLKATIVSLISIFIVALTAILLYCFWPAIKGTVNNSKYYTQEELQESYDKGYDDGCKTETELTAQVKYYKSLVDEYYIQVNTLNDEITVLTKTKNDYETQLSNMESQKNNLQTQVDNLTTIKTNNETTIESLNNQITNLQKQVTNLTNSGEDKSEQITNLNSQITTLQNTVAQLQTTNDMNVATITSLNTQITNLNSQITNLTEQSQNSQSRINALNNKINELQASVTYYENYIKSLENGEQVVATFEFDGSVYNIQIVNKGSKLSVTTPTSTTYKIFNGWTVNGSAIDLSTYTITTNTKIVADVTYKYDVKFKVDDTIYDSQIITKNNCATLPTNPTKDGYEFDGWSINGVDVISNITSTQVTENTTYIAVFTKLHTVKYMYEDIVKSTQTIRNGEFSTAPTIESTTYKVFNGWKVNGESIDNLATYKIFADTTFIADITYKYDVKFMVDDEVYNSQIVAKNSYATLPTAPVKEGYEFDGWSINGVDVIIVFELEQIEENTTYFAVFTKILPRINFYLSEFQNKFFNNGLVDKQKITSVTFDYYSENNNYFIDGLNLTDSVTPISFGVDNEIDFYQVGTDIYILSNQDIIINSLDHMFYTFYNLNKVVFNNFNTSYVTSMVCMFCACSALESVDLSSFNTTNVTDMYEMFLGCDFLTTIFVSDEFKIDSCLRSTYMFSECTNLVGAISYDSSKTDVTYANYTTGYFTYKAKN